MNLADIKPSERIIEIVHPKDKETKLGIRVSLVSISDPRMKGLKRRIQDERNRLEQRGKILKAEDAEENLHGLCFQAITSWEWYGEAEFNGSKPEFNKSNVLKVFGELEWFVNQISDAISDEAAFFQ